MALIVVSCVDVTDTPSTPSIPSIPSTPSDSNPKSKITEFYAEKDSWEIATKSSDSNMYLDDEPWKDGDKVMLIRTDVADSIVLATIASVQLELPELEVGCVEFDNMVHSIVTSIIDIDDMTKKHMCVV